jgi:Tfp pilus assembly protein PilV
VKIPPPARERGFTLIEATVSMAMLTVLLLGLFGSLLSSLWLSGASSEDAVALQCAQNQVEQMKATPFAAVFSIYYSPAGQSFAVPSLGAGASGTVTFLSEQAYGAATGKAFDLDFDGSTTGTVPNASYAFFPVQVTVTWRSVAGGPSRTLTITTAIFDNPGLPSN